MALELAVILALVLVNGLLSMAETAVVSARRPRLHQLADEGDDGASAALALSESPAAFLSTVQIGITLIGIGAGVFGGATMADELAALLAPLPRSAAWARPASYALIVSIITVLSLVLGELVPKRIALSRPERIASAVARPMQRLARVLGPFERLLTASSGLVLKLLRIRPAEEPAVTEEEVRVLIEKGMETGVFERHEKEMVDSVFDLGDRRVTAFMTPRRSVAWLDAAATAEELRATLTVAPHSRYPVGDGTLDDVVGFVPATKLLERLQSGEPLDVKGAVRPPLLLPESLTAAQALAALRGAEGHVALVVDEHGAVEGLVTLADVAASVVGGRDRPGAEGPEAVRREDGSWLLDGRLPVARLASLLGLTLPEEDEGEYDTLGGFVLSRLRRLPSEGDHFSWAGWRFEVVDMDERRVDKVLASRLAPGAAEER